MSSSDTPAPVENAASVANPFVPDLSVPTSDPDPSDDLVDIEVDPAPPPVDPDPVPPVEPEPNDVNVPIHVSVDVHSPPQINVPPKVPVGDPRLRPRNLSLLSHLDPPYTKAYRAMRSAIRELSLQKFVNLSSTELRTFILDALWKNECRNDNNDRFSAILSCLIRLKKHCKKN